jgi:hypothetical protein
LTWHKIQLYCRCTARKSITEICKTGFFVKKMVTV